MKKPVASRSQDFLQNSRVFTGQLQEWYRHHHRKLPWRAKPSLYKTVVSEFMLQQTSITTVLPYFDRWLREFPDFASVAKASEQKVMKLWEGLGYYSRARNLHKLAKTLTQLSHIPSDAESWMDLPGIGPYTAAAITSICFKRPNAVIDGNVIRVLSRLSANQTVFKATANAILHLKPMADTLIDEKNPGDHNQAMMELGATICLRNKPLCSQCPVNHFCLGFQSGKPESYPRLVRQEPERITVDRAWLIKNDALLLEHIPRTAKRLADIYELPRKNSLGSLSNGGRLIAVKKRAISNQRIKERIYAFPASPKRIRQIADSKHLEWINYKRLKRITLSGPHRRWINDLSQTYCLST